MKPKLASAVLVLFVLSTRPLAAQTEHLHGASPEIGAVLVQSGPEIDGILDDAAWQTATVIDQFTQQEPDEGAPASERTELRVIYDRSNLYLGITAFDSQPDGIIATEMRRDADRILEEDNFQIILDTFRDSRSAYMFVVTPLGAKLDQQVFEEGEGGRRGSAGNTNRDWDGVWNVQTQRTETGWTAEISIPMVSLRFPAAEQQTWGINFMRNISRRNEQAFWAPIPKGFGLMRVSLAGTLTNLSLLSRGNDLRIKPYVIGGGRSSLANDGTDSSLQRDIGLDVRLGLTAALNLDVTVNTDFAQAEADDERVNLTRFALFFPEKREFFLENSGQFNVGTLASNERMADLFFSRRVGLTETGARVPILGGARLTGKVGRNTVAMMSVQTDQAFDMPGENFVVARYGRDIFERSRIGGLIVNKQAMEGGHYNRTFAADMSLAPHPNLSIVGFVAKTLTPDISDQDMGGHLRAGWQSPNWNVYAEFTDIEDNFNAEAGYVPRVGIRTTKLHLERNPRPNKWGVRLLEPMWNITNTTDQSGNLLTRRLHHMLGVRFQDAGYLVIFYNNWFERLDDPFQVRQGVVIEPGRYHFGEWSFTYRSNPARRVYFNAGYSPQSFFNGDRTDMNFSLGVRLGNQLSTLAGVSRNEVDLPAGAFTANVGSLGLDYALSPNAAFRSLTQYNSLTEQWSTSARLRYSYRPGSDFYVVYDELRRDATGLTEIRDRQLILKVTYMVSR